MDRILLLAAVLLAIRLAAAYYLFIVLKRQWVLFKAKDSEMDATRKVLFTLVGVTFLGQFIPILIDASVLLGYYDRPQTHVIGIAYAISNATTALIAAVSWHYLYALIAKQEVKNAETTVRLVTDKKVLQEELREAKRSK